MARTSLHPEDGSTHRIQRINEQVCTSIYQTQNIIFYILVFMMINFFDMENQVIY